MVAESAPNGVIVNTELSWLSVANPPKLPSDSAEYTRLASALSLSVPVNVITVGVDPSIANATAPVGSMVKVGVALIRATLYQPDPLEI